MSVGGIILTIRILHLRRIFCKLLATVWGVLLYHAVYQIGSKLWKSI